MRIGRRRTTVSEHEAVLRAARTTYDTARTELFAAIRAALAAGVGHSVIARSSGFTREYIAKIRDGEGPQDA